MNKYLSDKLKVISLISMIMVVFLHSYNINVNFNTGNLSFNSGYNLFIQNFLSQGLVRIAVPVFFMISGFLFFLKFNGTKNEFKIKYKKRIKSLLIPYLLWSIYGLIFFYLLQLIPQSKDFFVNNLISNYSFLNILETIFINPIPYQLWFLRDLFIMVFFSPLIYLLIKYLRFFPILFLLIIWFGFVDFNFYILSNEALLFFFIGSYFAINKNNFIFNIFDNKYYFLFFILWIVILFIKTQLIQMNLELDLIIGFLHKLSILIGIISLWTIYDIVMKGKTQPNKIILFLTSFTFFIYAFHEPTLILIKKGLFYLIGNTKLIALFIYFIAPIFTILISILLGYYFKKYILKFYLIITGGR